MQDELHRLHIDIHTPRRYALLLIDGGFRLSVTDLILASIHGRAQAGGG